MKTIRDRKGFTLIENIIVVMLLLVVVTASLGLYPAVLKFFVWEENRLIAYNLAYSQIEDLREIARTSTYGSSGESSFADPVLVQSSSPNTYDRTDNVKKNWPAGFTLSYGITDKYRYPTSSTVLYKTAVVNCINTASGFKATLTADITQ